jgi:hypothetical protein
MKYDILEVINQIVRDGSRNSHSNSNSIFSESAGMDSGHFIISLKFFKYVTEADIYKEQREAEIIRTISFIDSEGFNSSFTKILMENQSPSVSSNPKQYTLLNFKNLVEAIHSQDLVKYSEVNSVFCSLVTDILRIQNSSLFFFGFIDQNEPSILESTVTLEIMNKFKNLNPDAFFEILQELNLDISNMNENNNLKEEFHTIENIFSELIYYLEKYFCSQKKPNIFTKEFYLSIRDLGQGEKYTFLKNYLQKKSFSLDAHPMLKSIFESVSAFLSNRSKWRSLFRARDEIIKLNMNYKETDSFREYKNVEYNKYNITSREPSVNETDELKVNLKKNNFI